MTEQTKQSLSTIIKTKAKMAMPEMTSIFLSKYEDQLYNLKNELTENLSDTRKQLETHQETVKLKAQSKFEKYNNQTMKNLGLTSQVPEPSSFELDFYNAEVTCNVRILDEKERNKCSVEVTTKITKADVETYEDLNKKIEDYKNKLTSTVNKIGDMSRKERQVKARISELRLEEAGLTNLLEDQEMLKLIEIK